MPAEIPKPAKSEFQKYASSIYQQLMRGDLEVRERPDLTDCRKVTVDIEYKPALVPQKAVTLAVTFNVVAVSFLHWKMLNEPISMTQNETRTMTFDFGPLPETLPESSPPRAPDGPIVNQYFVSADSHHEVPERNEMNGLLFFGQCPFVAPS